MLAEMLHEEELLEGLLGDAEGPRGAAVAHEVGGLDIGVDGVDGEAQGQGAEDVAEGREGARGDAEGEGVGEAEAPVDGVDDEVDDVGRAIGDEDHADAHVPGFVDAEVDELDGGIEGAGSISEEAGRGSLDERVADAVLAEDARAALGFKASVDGAEGFTLAVIGELVVNDEVALFVELEDELGPGAAEGARAKGEVEDADFEEEPLVEAADVALVDDGVAGGGGGGGGGAGARGV